MATRPDSVSVSAPAKINLCLHVGEKRPDGFHDLESLVAFSLSRDELLFERQDLLSLSITSMFAKWLTADDDNIVMKAARLLAAEMGVKEGARITLRKDVPVASGIGGGSADAAATLRGLCCLWDLDISAERLLAIAAKLGSDVPVCLKSETAWIQGRGERITPLPPLPDCFLVLVNPVIPVATADVFRKLSKRRGVGLAPPTTPFSDVDALVTYLRSTSNDLEAPAREIVPEIGDVLDEIARQPGALLTRMSGSGATCFGIFSDDRLAWSAGEAIVLRHRNWWISSARQAQPGEGLPRPPQ